MNVVYDLNEEITPEGRAVALGFFDGVHLGHKAVLEKAVLNRDNLLPCAFTFIMDKNFCPEKKKKSLAVQTEEEKFKCMEEIGIKEIFCPDFSSFMSLSPEEFAQGILIEKFYAKVICCGKDFRFGKNAQGDINFLKSICEKHKITLDIIDPVLYKGEIISSTAIRQAISIGDMKKATDMLGRYYSIESEVIHGKQLGRTIGFPTINQRIPNCHTVPKFGVYAAIITTSDGKKYAGAVNVGVKPTVGSDEVLAETYICDFNEEIYGKTVKTEFVEFLRGEKKFDSLDDLSNAIRKDSDKSRKIFMEILENERKNVK